MGPQSSRANGGPQLMRQVVSLGGTLMLPAVQTQDSQAPRQGKHRVAGKSSAAELGMNSIVCHPQMLSIASHFSNQEVMYCLGPKAPVADRLQRSRGGW